jgi:hypothetical protein
MWRRSVCIAGVVATVGLSVSGCGGHRVTESAAGDDYAARLMPAANSSVQRVVLSAQAVHRLGITTAPVQAQTVTGRAAGTDAVPLSAVLYDKNGATWVYTNPAANTYLRVPVAIAEINGDQVSLRQGPPVGTPVVTVGSAELIGIEVGVGGE